MDLNTIFVAVGQLIAVAAIIVPVYVARKNALEAAFEKIGSQLAEHATKHDQDVSDINRQIRALEKDIARDYLRRDDFDRSQVATQAALIRIEGSMNGVAEKVDELNVYLRNNPVRA